jgi:hypothetical protein
MHSLIEDCMHSPIEKTQTKIFDCSGQVTLLVVENCSEYKYLVLIFFYGRQLVEKSSLFCNVFMPELFSSYVSYLKLSD